MFRKKKPSIELHQSLLPALQIPKPDLQSHTRSQQLNENSPTISNFKSVQFTENPTTFKYQKDSSTQSEIDQSQDDETIYKSKAQADQKKHQELNKMIQKKMAIGGGFILDMSDFFKFKPKNKIQGDGLFQFVSGGHLSWIVLLYSVCNAAIMPAWIMSIKANKILRISWRFFLQAIFMIPFVLYQKRTGNQSIKKKYNFEYIFQLQGLKKVYLSSIGTSIWFTIILSCFQWTYISHSLVLGSLSNFFLSINRSINHSTHPLQPGGQIFVIVGIIFTLSDSYLMNVQQSPHSVWSVINTFYLTRSSIQRVIADLVIFILTAQAALSGAFIISRFSQKAADLKSYYPPFLSMLLVNISISFHVGLSAYYINGATFDRDTNFGVWGLFTDDHFGGFFYMAVVLSFGTYLGFTLISKLFTDPIIPALAMTLQPFFATFFLNLVAVQSMPGSFSIYGYIFLICGLFLILIGQFILQKERQKKQKQAVLEKQFKQKLIQRQAIRQEQEQQNYIIQVKPSKVQIKKQMRTQMKKMSSHQNNQMKGGHGFSDILHQDKILTI